MTAEQFATLVHGRKCGEVNVALCPAHNGRVPTLRIAQDSDGPISLYCFWGRSVDAVLKTVGLRAFDLFNGTSPVPMEASQVIEEGKRKDEEARKRRIADEAIFERLRRLVELGTMTSAQRTRGQNSAEADVLGALFHTLLDTLGALEDRLTASRS